jgi:hypothetical protein
VVLEVEDEEDSVEVAEEEGEASREEGEVSPVKSPLLPNRSRTETFANFVTGSKLPKFA